jgi:hypothetical protein
MNFFWNFDSFSACSSDVLPVYFYNNFCSDKPYGIFFSMLYILTRVPGEDDVVRGDGYYLKMK